MNAGLTETDAATGKWVLALIAVVAVAAGIYYWTQREAEPPAPAAEVAAALQREPAEPATSIEHPIEPPGLEPLPTLGESDDIAASSLGDAFPEGQFERLFVGADLVRRITATIDNLPRQKVATRLRPLQPMPDAFVATGPEEAPMLEESNFARYRPYVDVVAALDAKRMAAAYQRLYPLFQEAYEELGNPSAYFNDRVIDVIDHLLEAPEVRGPIPLARPNVLYEFANPELERLSAGQKFLVRIGPDNAARLKAKLRELRAELAS